MAGPTVRHLRSVPRTTDAAAARPYGVAVNTTPAGPTAADIARAVRETCRRDRRHQPTPGQMHRLLHLAQGHHLVWCDRPLFSYGIFITDTGVLIPTLRGHEHDGDPTYGDLDNAQLNAVGYVLSRYGSLSLHDLDLITRHSAPAVEAGRGRVRTAAATIRHDAMTDYFANVIDADPDTPLIDSDSLRGFLERSRQAAEQDEGKPAQPDDMDKLRKWVDDYEANYNAGTGTGNEPAQAKADARTA